MPTRQRLERIRRVVETRQRGVVVLEDPQSVFNAAAVVRSCEVFGFPRVMLAFERERRFNPRRHGRRAAGAANAWVDFEVFTSTAGCLRALRDEGCTLVATAVDERAAPLHEAELADANLALLLGNERRGLSEEAMAAADRVVTVPMRGMTQSLNLSVTASLCLYEITRQRERAGMERYLLGADDRAALEARLIERRASGTTQPHHGENA